MARGERDDGFVERRSGTDGYGRRERSPRERSPGSKRGREADYRHRDGRRNDDDRGRSDWSRDGERGRDRYSGSNGGEGRFRSEREEDRYWRSSKGDHHGRLEKFAPSPERGNHRERERDRKRDDSPVRHRSREQLHGSNRSSKESPPRRLSGRISSHNEDVANSSDGVDGDSECEEDRRKSKLPGGDRRRGISPKAINRDKSGDEETVRRSGSEGSESEGDRQAAPALVDYADNDEERGNSERKVVKDGSDSDSHCDDDEERIKDKDEESRSSSGGSSEDERGRAKNKKVRKHEKRGKHSESKGKKRKHQRSKGGRGHDDSSESYTSPSSNSDISDSEEEERRRKKRKKGKRKEKEKEKERGREREMKRKVKRKKKELKEKKLKTERKKKDRELRSKKPITTSWGKYGILKDIDMWNKRPEFNAWLAEVKKVNLESLSNWEEKQMFKEYMEDYNTATFPSRKYYNLDIYHRRKLTKQTMMKGMAKLVNKERTDFNDEDDRRLELQREREQQKEAEVESLLRKMQSGMAQDMKEQAKLREEMQYQFRLGNTEAAQAIQRRLDPDADKFANN